MSVVVTRSSCQPSLPASRCIPRQLLRHLPTSACLPVRRTQYRCLGFRQMTTALLKCSVRSLDSVLSRPAQDSGKNALRDDNVRLFVRPHSRAPATSCCAARANRHQLLAIGRSGLLTWCAGMQQSSTMGWSWVLSSRSERTQPSILSGSVNEYRL